MSEIPVPLPSELEPSKELDIQAIIGSVLPRGHAIHGYSSASNERVIKILGTHKYSDSEPMLGFGVDSDAELALARALATYIKREQEGLEFMTATQYPDLTEGWAPYGGHASKFDNLVWGGHFTLYQKGKKVIAWSQYGGGWGMESFEVSGDTPLEAMEKLTSEYVAFSSFQDVRDRISALPGLTWLVGREVSIQELEGNS